VDFVEETGPFFLGHMTSFFGSFFGTIYSGVNFFGHHFGLPKLKLLHVFLAMGSFVVLFILVGLLLFLVVKRVAQVLKTNVIERIQMRPLKTMFGFFLCLLHFFLVDFLAWPLLSMVSQKMS